MIYKNGFLISSTLYYRYSAVVKLLKLNYTNAFKLNS